MCQKCCLARPMIIAGPLGHVSQSPSTTISVTSEALSSITSPDTERDLLLNQLKMLEKQNENLKRQLQLAETRSALQFDLEGDHQERSAGGTQDKSASDPAVQKTGSAAAAAPSARNRSLAAATSATNASRAAVAPSHIALTTEANDRSLAPASVALVSPEHPAADADRDWKQQIVALKWLCVRCTIVISDGRSSKHYDFPHALVDELMKSTSYEGEGQQKPNKCFVAKDALGNPEVCVYVLGNPAVIPPNSDIFSIALAQGRSSQFAHAMSGIVSKHLPDGVSGTCVAFGLLVKRWTEQETRAPLIFAQDLEFKSIDSCVSHCIVGMPLDCIVETPLKVKDGRGEPDMELTDGRDVLDSILEYHSHSSVCDVSAGNFYRLLHGLWTDGDLVDWYTAYLSREIQS